MSCFALRNDSRCHMIRNVQTFREHNFEVRYYFLMVRASVLERIDPPTNDSTLGRRSLSAGRMTGTPMNYHDRRRNLASGSLIDSRNSLIRTAMTHRRSIIIGQKGIISPRKIAPNGRAVQHSVEIAPSFAWFSGLPGSACCLEVWGDGSTSSFVMKFKYYSYQVSQVIRCSMILKIVLCFCKYIRK